MRATVGRAEKRLAEFLRSRRPRSLKAFSDTCILIRSDTTGSSSTAGPKERNNWKLEESWQQSLGASPGLSTKCYKERKRTEFGRQLAMKYE
jgi:hypothetical protein